MSTGDHPQSPDRMPEPAPEPQGSFHYAYGYGAGRDRTDDEAPAALVERARGGRSPVWTVLGIIAGLAVLIAVGATIGLVFFANDDPEPGLLPGVPTSSVGQDDEQPSPSAPATDGTTGPTASEGPELVAASDMEPGTCFADPYADATQMPDGTYAVSGYTVLPCDEPHYGEVFLQTRSSAADYNPDALVIESEDLCYAGFADYVGTSYEESSLYMEAYTPTAETWAQGDRAVTCAAIDPSGVLTAPVKGSGR